MKNKKKSMGYFAGWIICVGMLCQNTSLQADAQAADSLRSAASSVPVVVQGDTLFNIYAGQGGLTPQQRAKNAERMILEAGKEMSFKYDTLRIAEGVALTDIMYGDKVIFSITDRDAQQAGFSRRYLAEQYYFPPISTKIAELKKSYGILQILKRGGLFILVIALQVGLIYVTNHLFRKLKRKIVRLKQTKLKSIRIQDYEFLDIHRQGLVLMFLSKLLKWIIILLQLVLTILVLFIIFPQTESIANTLFQYIFEPTKMIIRSVINYIPKLFIITLIYLCVKYLVKGVRYITREIETEKLKLSGFYPDWAKPTFNIIRFLLYAFMIALIYPYLPGSQTDVFKGISVFVGLIVSLGSSTVMGNIMAGFVITYMRPFKVGDRIKLHDTEGNVVEKTLFVTRLRTPKNEIVTIPNSFVLAYHTTNHSASAKTYGLIIHINVGFGYEVPWQRVHPLLIEAALKTPKVSRHPNPFVLEVEMKDSYAEYQINAYVKEVDQLPRIYSDLRQNIHNLCQEAGLELVLPHYYAQRDGNPAALPPEYLGNETKQ